MKGNETVGDSSIEDTVLKTEKDMATFANGHHGISNGKLPVIKPSIDASVDAKSVDVDAVNAVKMYAKSCINEKSCKNEKSCINEMSCINETDLNSAYDNDVEGLKLMIDTEGKEHEEDGLQPTSETNENEDESLNNAPIDRGWAWAILFGAYLEILIFGGFMKCNGIFFIAYQERFKSSASQTSLILTIQNMTTSFTGIFVMTMGMKYMTARTSILIGAFLQASFCVLSAFAENFAVLYFTQGFIPGLAGAMIYLPIVSTINTYFNKYRGLANSISMSGSSLGGLIFGPIYTLLFEEYGYTGTYLIVSGIFFNIMITGVLMRPIEFYTKHYKSRIYGGGDTDETKEKLITQINGRKQDDSNQKQLGSVTLSGSNIDRNSFDESGYALEDETVTYGEKRLKGGAHPEKIVKRIQSVVDDEQAIRNVLHKRAAFTNFNRSVSHDPESLTSRHFPSPSLKRAKLGHFGSHSLSKTSSKSIDGPRKRTFSENSHSTTIHGMIESISRSRVALYTGGDMIYSSMANISVVDHDEAITNHDPTSMEHMSKTKRSNSNASTIGRIIVDFFRTVFDISLLKSRVFIHFLCLAFVMLPGSILPSVYFAPYAKEIGITSSQIGTMFPIIGCLDMISRITVGFIADKKWLRPTSILCVTAIIVGTMSHLIRFFTSYGAMIVFVVIIGTTSGAYMSLYAVTILEHMGLDQFKGALGWATMCHGVANAIYFPVTGGLRDETGTYFASFHLIGVTMYLAAALSFLLPFTSRRHRAA